MTQIVYTCSTDGVKAACAAINSGGVIIFPTDTVYGIGCSPFKNKAINRVYKIKGRDTAKQLPVLANSYDDLAKFCQFDSRHKKLADKFWPGPVTMVVKLLDIQMAKTMGLEDTVAVRVPAGDCPRAVLASCGPLACTSANISGAPSAIKYSQCAKLDVDVGLDGGIVQGTESTIIDATVSSSVCLRKGRIGVKEVHHVTWPGQNLSASFLCRESNWQNFARSSYELARTGSCFAVSLPLILYTRFIALFLNGLHPIP